jgi:predicted DCC family thiol-disulfide oxidoreductase YuxK
MAKKRSVILYDAGCNLCLGTCAFVNEHGGADRYRFVPLDSPEAAELLPADQAEDDTLHLFDESGHHDRSTAVLRIVAQLDRPWSWLGVFRFLPRFLRDPVYRFVARNRVRWFGRRDPRSKAGRGNEEG